MTTGKNDFIIKARTNRAFLYVSMVRSKNKKMEETILETSLAIVYVPVDELKPYEKNARKHTDKDVQSIVESIHELGFNDPIGIWGDENLIVEGHGRLLAAKKLGMQTVPCIRLDHLTDKQRRAYALAHNKTAELSSWLDEVLESELNDLTDFDMAKFGFDIYGEDDGIGEVADGVDISRYAQNAKIPQYEIKGDMPEIADLVDQGKQKALIEEIEDADIPQDIKDFLKLAAHRHDVFNYRNIAEFYAHQNATVQRLMEKSALVIIDINDAIANGYVKLTKTIQDIIDEDEGEADA